MDRVRDAYGAIADLYIELFGSSGQVHPDDLAFITRHLALSSGTVLDVGCGPGHLTDHLRTSLGVDAKGIDLVPEFIAHARATHPTVDYQVGSMAGLPAGDGSLAGILAWFSLIHLPPEKVDGVLAEFRRVLRPGGTVVVGFVEGAEVEAFDHKVVTAYRWPADAFSERLAGAGFAEIERQSRPAEGGQRPVAAIAAVLSK